MTRRRRRGHKVTVAALLVGALTALACAFRASLCWHGGTAADGAWNLLVCAGSVALVRYEDTMPKYPGMVPSPGLSVTAEPSWPVPFPFVLSDSAPPSTLVALPLSWAACGLVLWAAVLRRRRWPPGSCGSCGYSLAGLAEGAACPECGGAPL